jgi:hypothetical protein
MYLKVRRQRILLEGGSRNRLLQNLPLKARQQFVECHAIAGLHTTNDFNFLLTS